MRASVPTCDIPFVYKWYYSLPSPFGEGAGVRLVVVRDEASPFPFGGAGEALLLNICLLKTVLLLLINDDKNERNNDGCNATRGEERFHGEVAWVVLIE